MIDQRTDFDSPWKEILEKYFKEFTQFFFPAVYEGIDWLIPYVFLDKELQQIVRDAELGRRLVDKLVRVYTHEGKKYGSRCISKFKDNEKQDSPGACTCIIIVFLIATIAMWSRLLY